MKKLVKYLNRRYLKMYKWWLERWKMFNSMGFYRYVYLMYDKFVRRVRINKIENEMLLLRM